jgi:hypothetical protein
MKQGQLYALIAILGFFLGACLAFTTEPRPDMPVTINEPGAAWTSSSEYPPPEGKVIVGYWVVKGWRLYDEVYGSGGKWYDSTSKATVLHDRPPVEWTGQPGAAR